MNPNSFAITFTVKDEWDLLRFIIPYYLGRGTARIYLYWDGTADAARDQCQLFRDIESRDCVSVSELENLPDWVQPLNPIENMDHRKRINTLHAAERARRAGISWIACLDPDEIVLPPNGQKSIDQMLAAVPEGVDQLLVPNLELLPIAAQSSENPFISQRLFIRRQDYVASLWRGLNWGAHRWLTPSSRARIESGLYRLTNKGMFPHIMKNPLSGMPIHRSLFLGYNNHKAFIRTAVAHHHNFNIHKWQRSEHSLKSIKRGHLLHYDLPTFEYYLKKFRQRPANMQLAAFNARFQIGEIARNASFEVARDFYEREICCPNLETAEALVHAGIATWINDVAENMISDNQSAGDFHHGSAPGVK